MTNNIENFDVVNYSELTEISVDEAIDIVNGEPVTRDVWVHFNNTGEEKCFKVELKNCLTAEETIEFYNYVVNYIVNGFPIKDNDKSSEENNEEDEEGTVGYQPYSFMMFFNTALIYFFVNDNTIKELTISELWSLIGNTNIIQIIRSYASAIQINEIENALHKFEKLYIKINYSNSSDEMVSSFAGLALQLADGIDKINAVIDTFEEAMIKNGKFNTKELSRLFKLLKDVDGLDVLKQLFGSQKLSEKEDDNNGSSKED